MRSSRGLCDRRAVARTARIREGVRGDDLFGSTRGCGAPRTSRTRVPSSACRRGGGEANAEARRAARLAVGKRRRVGQCLGGGSDRCSRGRDDAGAHARHMRRRTSGLCQLTLPPRPISRVSSASLPFIAASNTALPIESLIASAALYRPSPARTPAHSGGGTRGSAVTLGRRRRALRRGAHAARPHAPRSSGGGGSRGARARRGRSKRPRRAVEAAATPGSRGPEQRGVGVRSSGRSRPSGSTRALGNARPHEGLPNSRPPLALTYRQLLEQPRDETSVKQKNRSVMSPSTSRSSACPSVESLSLMPVRSTCHMWNLARNSQLRIGNWARPVGSSALLTHR